MFNIKSIVLSLLASFMLIGCANQNSQMQRSEIYDSNKNFDNNKVSFVDDMDVLVSSIRTIKEGDFLKIMVEFINADDGENEDFVYQIEWYDENGMLKETTSWKPKRVIGNQKLKIIEMTTVPNIVDYKIIISTKNN
ncbi:MAG: DUF1425 domain-containing protein [Aliarcobacter sp.]|nr:DUF1425 domain-containing protein [Aliarcobacter sp.]